MTLLGRLLLGCEVGQRRVERSIGTVELFKRPRMYLLIFIEHFSQLGEEFRAGGLLRHDRLSRHQDPHFYYIIASAAKQSMFR